MAPSANIVRFNQQDSLLTFRVEGRATMTQSLPVRRHAERAIEAGARRVLFDLRDCSHMDSTFLGTLLTIKKALDRTSGELALVTPSTPCSRILHQMGLGDVLPAENLAIDPQTRWTDLTNGSDDTGSFKRNIVQAHEELASLPGKSGEQFQAVVRCMNEAEKQPRPPE